MKRFKLALVAGVICIAAFAFSLRQTPASRLEKRIAAAWDRHCDFKNPAVEAQGAAAARSALAEAGPDAIPILLGWIEQHAESHPVRNFARHFVSCPPFSFSPGYEKWANGLDIRHRSALATCGFHLLGTNAAVAAARLRELSRTSGDAAEFAAEALASATGHEQP